MNNEIIVVKQLPEIEERLQEIKADITRRVNDAMSLACTEDTVKEIKAIRAELNKEFAFWEEKRKEVKQVIMKPYNSFDERYKECITEPFEMAKSDLTDKINSVERELKDKKAAEVKAYFDEYLASKNITMPLTFECAEINVTLTASMKSLKEKAKAFIDRVCDDLKLIETQEYKDEIYHEYNAAWFLNVSGAITTVVNRHKAIEEAKAREAERQARLEAEQKAAEKVEIVVETLTPPTIAPPVEEEPILTLHFTVKGTRTQLRALKAFLNNGGYDYE